MAFITKSEIKRFSSIKMTAEDYRVLSDITREEKMKRSETGFTPVMMRNFALLRHTCSPEVKELILNYFTDKLKDFKKGVDKVEI